MSSYVSYGSLLPNRVRRLSNSEHQFNASLQLWIRVFWTRRLPALRSWTNRLVHNANLLRSRLIAPVWAKRHLPTLIALLRRLRTLIGPLQQHLHASLTPLLVHPPIQMLTAHTHNPASRLGSPQISGLVTIGTPQVIGSNMSTPGMTATLATMTPTLATIHLLTINLDAPIPWALQTGQRPMIFP